VLGAAVSGSTVVVTSGASVVVTSGASVVVTSGSTVVVMTGSTQVETSSRTHVSSIGSKDRFSAHSDSNKNRKRQFLITLLNSRLHHMYLLSKYLKAYPE